MNATDHLACFGDNSLTTTKAEIFVYLSAETSRTTRVFHARHKKTFLSISNGSRSITNTNEAELFLESIYSQADKQRCVESIISGSHGLRALRTSLRLDLSNDFVNKHVTEIILYLDDVEIDVLCAGELRRKLLETIVNPPSCRASCCWRRKQVDFPQDPSLHSLGCCSNLFVMARTVSWMWTELLES